MEPVNYGALLTQLDLSPIAQGLQRRDQRQALRAATEQQRNTGQLARDEFDAAQSQARDYAASVDEVVRHPTFENFSAHQLRFPKQIEASKQAWDTYDDGMKRTNMGYMLRLHGLIKSGNLPDAVKLTEERKASLENDFDRDGKPGAAVNTTETSTILSMLKSGDPKQVEAARGLALYGVGLAAGPDKFADIIKSVGGDPSFTLSPGSKRFDQDGNVVADAPFAPDRFTLGPGQTRYEGSTSPSSAPGGAAQPSIADVYSRMVSAESGGQQFTTGGRTLRSPKGAVGAAQIMPTTGPEAAKLAGVQWDAQRFHNDKEYNLKLGQAYFQKQMQDFGDPAQAAAAYNAGPGRVRAAINRGGDNWLDHVPSETRNYVSKVVDAASPGREPMSGARATATGGPRPTPEQAKRMSADEVRAEGLDPAVVYYRSKDGIPVPVSGQTTPKPGATGDQAYSQSAMDSFDRAIGSAKQLLSHKGLGAAVGSGFDPSSWGSYNPISGETLAGTNAADFMARLTTLKAQVFLPMVQSMKGMGALSNAEGEKLTAAIGALDTKQSEGEFKSSLNQVIADLDTYKKRAAGKGGRSAPTPAQGQRLSVAEAAKLPPGTRFIGTDGKSRVRQ